MVGPVVELQWMSGGYNCLLRGRFRVSGMADPGRCNGQAILGAWAKMYGEAVGAMGDCVWALRRKVALDRTASCFGAARTESRLTAEGVRRREHCH